jgi:hypothetical protein
MNSIPGLNSRCTRALLTLAAETGPSTDPPGQGDESPTAVLETAPYYHQAGTKPSGDVGDATTGEDSVDEKQSTDTCPDPTRTNGAACRPRRHRLM